MAKIEEIWRYTVYEGQQRYAPTLVIQTELFLTIMF